MNNRTRHELVVYFALAFAISWTGVLLSGAGAARELTFIAMLAGPSIASIAVAFGCDGMRGVRDIGRALVRSGFSTRWYAALLVAPALLVVILGVLSIGSPVFLPGVLKHAAGSMAVLAVLGGLTAGIFEEAGWTGFATPRLLERRSWLAAGLWMGVAWGLWHTLPDYVHGARYGTLWSAHMLEWIVALTGYRVLMTWVYSRTKSLLVGMAMHAAFTGSQLLLWPAAASVSEELVWYGLFALGIWVVVMAVVARTGVVSSVAATPDERRRPMAGDAIVPDPFFVVTHAITIDAPPERVWPWLAQLGSTRGGWYSYDAIDNGGRPSAEQVLPEHQDIRRGDVMPALPGARDAFIVAAADAPRDLILTVPGASSPVVSWEHQLESIGPGRTRLIVRGRAAIAWKAMARRAGTTGGRAATIERVYRGLGRLPDSWMRAFAGVGHRWMEARHLRGIKRRAEAMA